MKYFNNLLVVLLIVLVASNIYAQEKAVFVRYTVERNGEKSLEDLLAKGFLGVYRVNPKRMKIQQDTNSGALPYPDFVTIPEQKFFKETRSDIMYFESSYKNAYCMVRDSLPRIYWQKENRPGDSRMICGYICKKAVADFRGSQIVAYYTDEIPLPFGPWKFKDLPGVILQVYNVNGDRDFMWVASKVEYPYKGKLEFNFPKNIKVISQKKYIQEQEQEWRNQMKKSEPKPDNSYWDNIQLKRLGIEKIYEWE